MRHRVRALYRTALIVCVALVGLTAQQPLPAARAADSSTWYWQNPLPRGYQLSAIACRSATSCVAAGIDGSITTTDDGGQHWIDRATGIAAGVTLLSCPDPAVCYALDTQAPFIGGSPQKVHYVLLRSTDGGATWQVASHFQGNTPQSPNSFACPGPTTCLIGVGQSQGVSILRTADGGKTWQAVHPAAIGGISTVVCPTSTVCYAVGANNSDSRLLRSGDGGKTWTAHGLHSPPHLEDISCPGAETCFGITPPCSGACNAGGDVFVTRDGARTWKRAAAKSTGDIPGFLGGIACPNVTTCYAEGDGWVVRTTDGGKTWSVHRVPDRAGAMTCPSRTTCYVAAGFTVLKTSDGFNHTRETLAHSVVHRLYLTDISCPNTVSCYASGSRTLSCDGGQCPVPASSAATSDGGKTWRAMPKPPAIFTRLSCPNPTVCYAIPDEEGSQAAVYRSGDGTRTWKQTTWQQMSARINAYNQASDISCVDGTSCFLLAPVGVQENGPAQTVAVLVTHDDGQTWSLNTSIDAAARAGATRTITGIATSRISCPSVTACVALATVYYPIPTPGQEEILSTTDGGKSWTRHVSPPSAAPVGPGVALTQSLSCPTVTTCYLLPYTQSPAEVNPNPAPDPVLVTHDAGATWRSTDIDKGVPLTAIACATADSCRVAAASGGIFATEDGGASWQRQLMADGTQAPFMAGIACPAIHTCYAVGGPTNYPDIGVQIVATHPGGHGAGALDDRKEVTRQ